MSKAAVGHSLHRVSRLQSHRFPRRSGTLAVLNQLNASALAESAGSVEREVRLTLALNPEP